MSAPLLHLATVSVRLGGRQVLDRVSLDVSPGELLAVVGPNGAGKTTLLRAVVGLLAAEGSIALNGTPLAQLSRSDRAASVGYLPQGHTFHWPLAVSEIIGLGRLPRGAGADLSTADRAAVERAIAAAGLRDFAERPVTTLSGGERARVALARVLATEAPLILADEPTASLDPRYQIAVCDILRRHARSGGAVLAVMHDLGLAARYADRIVVMADGRIVADGTPAEVLSAERLVEVFGVVADVIEVKGAAVVVPHGIAPGP